MVGAAPPHLGLCVNGGQTLYDVEAGAHNLWHALVLLLAHVRTCADNRLCGMVLGPDGLNLNYVTDAGDCY